MKIKKHTSMIISAFLAILYLAGCSGEKHIISYDSGATASETLKAPAIAADSIKAALLVPDGSDSDACMSNAHISAIKSAAEELGIEDVEIVSSDPASDNTLGGTDGANVIFAACYDYMNALDEAAKENSEKLYACFGGYKYNSTNYTNYYSAIYEAQYLAGIAAGTNTDSGKIGIVSDYAAEYPDSAAEINSFALGAKAAFPEAEIIVRTLSSRTDTSRAGEYASSLISEGCDVISIQCNSSAPASSAISKDVYFIGYGTDMSSIDQKLCLTSVVWNFKEYYKSALSSAINGTWAASGNYYGALSDGAVSVSLLSETANALTQARIDSASELITGNLLEIFSNRKLVFDSSGKASVTNSALIDNNKNIMITEDGASYFIYSGEELKAVDALSVTSDKLASASMNYLVEGVTVRQ